MYNTITLDNGIRVIHRQNSSAVTYAGVYINVGSRNEQGAEEGIAHFIEHSIFKGTEHRRSCHIRNRIDGVGGELDAFTTKEETCIYATVMGEHLERSLELFADVLFHSVFPSHEIEKEKDVVIEEINLYKDSPADLIFDDYEELAFGSHPLAHNILGSKRNVKHFTPEQLKAFMQSHYTPDRMVVSVVGNVEFSKLVRLCRKYFGAAAPAASAAVQPAVPQWQPVPFNTTVHKRTHQVHMLAGCPAPTLYDSRRTPFQLLCNILGGPAMNSRLNVAVREKQGFCYSIESQYVPFTDAGLFYIYAGVDADASDHATELVMAELRRLREQPLSAAQLRAAQQQMIGQMAINNDNGLNEMQSIGKAFLNFEHVDTIEEMNRDILAVTAPQLQQVAQELLAEEKISFLYYK